VLTADSKTLRKGDVTRQKIILAAATVLSERGFSETKLEDIAREAGTKAGSLYYHFESREDIVCAVLQACMEMIGEQVETALSSLPANASFVDILRQGVGAHLHAILSDKPYVAAYNRIINEVPQHVKVQYLESPRRYGQKWQELILRAQATGELRKDLDASMFRLLLFGAVTWCQLWFKPGGRKSEADLRDHIVEIFLQGALEFDE
jgi:AcrR family transcriptional regulator